MVCAKLENADQHIVDLKQQLDNALGAEEMLEQLTERTLFMGEVWSGLPHSMFISF